MLSRESTVTLLSALLLSFSAWTWGGVILWAQWVVAGLGLLTLALALLPSASVDPVLRKRLWLTLGISITLGLITGGYFAWSDLSLVLTQREATLQLLPDASLDSLAFAQWGIRGLFISLGVTFFSLIIGGFTQSSSQRRRLIRFLPFWLGLFLFAWIACQSWNTWGVVVQHDLFWRILPQDYITWLPSGLDAPFASSEEPGGMNGWRQLLIFIGPWALLCALRASVLHRRSYAWLAIIAVVNGLGIFLAGNLARANKWKDFLGVSEPDLSIPPFGPFIYKNQAGAFLCLATALALALMYYLAKRRGGKVDRGGPHLLVGIAVVFLALGAASTMSFASVAIAAALVIVVAPIAYFFDRKLRNDLSPLPAITLVALGGIVVYAGLLSVDAKKWRHKIQSKQQQIEYTGIDDRAPLRTASWMMMETVSPERQLSGWGAGSYRWVSPKFLETQPAFLNKRGQLDRRATHAHNDWLQAPVEWGLAGWVVVVGVLSFLALRVRAQFRRPTAPGIALLGGLALFSGHAFFDFLLFIPQLSLLAVMVAWLVVVEGTGDDTGH